MAKRWTTREKYRLIQGVGIYGVSWFLRHGRTVGAVYRCARRIYGYGGLTRGSYSVDQVVRETGYGVAAIHRAANALGQKWKRTSAKAARLIYEDQLYEIIEWLKTDYWSKSHRLYNCLWCGTDKQPHEGQGLCVRCYRVYRGRLLKVGLPFGPGELLTTLSLEGCVLTGAIVSALERGRALAQKELHVVLSWARRRHGQ